jgi:TonB-linked SusC/RagA family outer membrane protein
MPKKLLVGMLFTLLLLQHAWAQSRMVTGTVRSSADNSPLPGVNVLVKGTNNGTTTNAEGGYSLQVTGEPVLVFSFIGFRTQEAPLGDRTSLDVQLQEDVTNLQEVVVTGALGIENNARVLGYTVQEISGDMVAQRAEPDLLRALTGKVTGIQITGSNGAPGSSTNIVIRGNNTTRNNQPLFVVDGVPFDNSTYTTSNTLISGSAYSNRMADINPADIESITVLKGGAAAALYGSRAANGVIVITTKANSRKFSSRKGLEVTFNSSYSLQQVAKLPNFQNEFGQGNEGKFVNGNFGNWGPAFSELDSVTDHTGQRVKYQAYPDNVKDFYETGSIFDNQVSVSTGSEKFNFFSSFGRMKQLGIIPHTDFNRTNINVGGSVRLDNGFVAGGSLSYTLSDQLGPQLGGGGVADASVHRVLWYIPRSYDLTGRPYIDPNTNASLYYRSDIINPYWIAQENPFTSRINRINGNVNLSYDITSWLNASYRIGYNTYHQFNREVYARTNPLNPLGQITEDNINFREIESNFLLTATKDLSEDFDMRLIVGHNVNDRFSERQAVVGTGIIVWGIDNIYNTNLVTPYNTPVTQTQGLTNRRLFGVFLDAQLGFRNYAYLNFTGRNDWSSTLPRGNNNYFYPAVSGSFIFTEAFNLNTDVLSLGKIRAGWSRVGNDATPYSIQTVYFGNNPKGNNLATIGFPFNGVSSITLGNTLGNEDLKPEFTNEIELGTDLSFFGDRINLNFTYYDKTTTDLITNITVPATSGFLGKVINAGEINNKGIEIGLDVTPVKTVGGLTWNLFANFTRNRNKVISLAQGQQQIDVPGSRFGSRGQVLRVGMPFGAIEGQGFLRDDEGNLLINPSNGLPIADPASKIIGDIQPDFLLGVTNTISYKGLSLSFLIDTKVGGDMFIATIQDMRARGVLPETAVDRDRGFLVPGVLADLATNTPLLSGDNQKIPNTLQVTANEFWFNGPMGYGSDEGGVFDATWIRLREISLGYQLPKTLLEKLPIGTVNVSLIGRNLWFATPNLPKDVAIDPETSGQGAGNLQGMIENYVPNTKSYGVNLRVTF